LKAISPGTTEMTNNSKIQSDTCDLRVECEGNSVFIWVQEDCFDGKVEAMTQLSLDDAKKLHDILRDFLGD